LGVFFGVCELGHCQPMGGGYGVDVAIDGGLVNCDNV